MIHHPLPGRAGLGRTGNLLPDGRNQRPCTLRRRRAEIGRPRAGLRAVPPGAQPVARQAQDLSAMTAPVQGCHHVGGRQPRSDDQDACIVCNGIERALCIRVCDIGRRAGNGRQRRGRAGARMRCGKDQQFRFGRRSVRQLHIPAVLIAACLHRPLPQVPDTPVCHEGGELLRHVAAENPALRKQRAGCRPACGRVVPAGGAGIQPILEMAGFVRKQAHPRGRHVDAVGGIGG